MSSAQVNNSGVNCNGDAVLSEPQSKLTSSASFKVKRKPAPAASISRAGSEVDELITLLHGSDPLRVELNRLENEVRGLIFFNRFLFGKKFGFYLLL